MADRLLIEVSDRQAGTSVLLEQFGAFASLHQLPVQIQRDTELALDEVMSNIMRHGYGHDGPYRITVELAVERGVLEIQVIDDARAFNPLEARDPNTDVTLAERPLGGLGLYLVKRLMDRLEYSRRDDRNHLVMTRTIGDVSES